MCTLACAIIVKEVAISQDQKGDKWCPNDSENSKIFIIGYSNS